MKVLFLDIDGVLNSYQSATFWHNKRDQSKWENEMYKDWQGTLKEYIAQEFCPIAISNLEELMRDIPDLKIVVSSTWRLGETVESLKKIFEPFSLISNAIIDKTPYLRSEYKREEYSRGKEIKYWLNEHPEADSFVILDDDSDMDELVDRLVLTNAYHGLQWADLLKIKEMFGVNSAK